MSQKAREIMLEDERVNYDAYVRMGEVQLFDDEADSSADSM